MPFAVAVIVEVPEATPVTTPSLSTVALPVLLEVQETVPLPGEVIANSWTVWLVPVAAVIDAVAVFRAMLWMVFASSGEKVTAVASGEVLFTPIMTNASAIAGAPS